MVRGDGEALAQRGVLFGDLAQGNLLVEPSISTGGTNLGGLWSGEQPTTRDDRAPAREGASCSVTVTMEGEEEWACLACESRTHRLLHQQIRPRSCLPLPRHADCCHVLEARQPLEGLPGRALAQHLLTVPEASSDGVLQYRQRQLRPPDACGKTRAQIEGRHRLLWKGIALLCEQLQRLR